MIETLLPSAPVSVEIFYFGIPKYTIRIVGVERTNQVTQVGVRLYYKDPSALSSAGIMQAVKKYTGVDLQTIPGYRGAYEFSSAGADWCGEGCKSSGRLAAAGTAV